METLDGRLASRINKTKLEKFKAFCTNELKRDYQEVVREFIDASMEGRLTITPTDAQRKAMGIYGDK